VLTLVSAALWTLRGQLPTILQVARSTHPRWRLVAGASVITLLVYALLIECWRRVLAELGGHLRVGDAALIWLGSNLARYLPGAFWQIGVMGAMAQRRGVPLSVSTAASLLITLVSTFTGMAIFFAALATLAVDPGAAPSLSSRAMLFVAVGTVGLAASPFVVPWLARIGSRLTAREIVLPRFSVRALLVAGAGTAIAWIGYGLAFWILARAVLPDDGLRSVVGCVALYTFSYLVGLFNPMPAGIGVTEPVMVLLAPQFGVATTAEATVLALFVRAWRTVLEMAPSLIAVAIASLRGHGRGTEGQSGAIL
jgi:uncharacterized membrane protein YbhN (UPF0104 family)